MLPNKSIKNLILLNIHQNKVDLIGEMYLLGILKQLFYIKILKNSINMFLDKNHIKLSYELYSGCLEKNLHWFYKLKSNYFFT